MAVMKRFRAYFCLVLSCGLINGCTLPHSQARVVSSALAHSPRSRMDALPGAADGHVLAMAQVQSTSLYRQAIQACRRKDYREATRLLQQLAHSPALSSEQILFVQQQRNLCLRDAGLPVPRLATAPATSTPLHATRPLSPEEADCGPRALLLLCGQLGVNTTLERLRMLAGTTGKGTSLAGLAKAAQTLGLQTQGVQVSREALPEMQTPAIAWINHAHYDTVLALQGRSDQGTATIHDPNQSHEETISQERLLRLSSGYLLLVHR
jgi:plasmid replication initiation protein